MSDMCEIIVKGHLDTDWSGWFEGLTITHNGNGETMLSGQVRDQAALYGLLAKVRDMGLSLILVKCFAGESTKESSNDIGDSQNHSKARDENLH
jgi:hypothetical protein